MNDSQKLRKDAVAIWNAGLNAVRSDALVQQHVTRSADELTIGGVTIPLNRLGRIVVVGAGKAGAGMSKGLEVALGDELMQSKNVSGWVNVPENCVRELRAIHLHAARPAGVNEPTQAGVEGSAKIIELVSSLGESDLCICLISGGGSALLPAPQGVSLAEKQAVTRFLSAAGANIGELNTVRKQLSAIKGGGLARACQAGRLITLIISDVIGNPLDLIASGPTVEDTSTPKDARAVLANYDPQRSELPQTIYQTLENKALAHQSDNTKVTNVVIGENATAVSAAAREAERLGYRPFTKFAEGLEGEAESIATDHAKRLLHFATDRDSRYDCFISGGEPTVKLAPANIRGKGGRNQQLVLSALKWLLDQQPGSPIPPLALVSGGTDGEDGPTTAAGAMLDASIAQFAAKNMTKAEEALRTNNAYEWFRAAGGLLETGPTDTNVCDLRVGLVNQK